MEFKRATEQDLKNLIPLYKKEFPVHNIFQKESEEEILTYLKEANQTEEIHVGIIDNEVVCGVVLVQTGKSRDQTHTVWKFRHFAVKERVSAEEFLTYVEGLVKEKSDTVKIEMTFAEDEQKYIEIFKNEGYVLEGTLENHYRPGEKTYLYGKTIK